MNLHHITLKDGREIRRFAWTGGDTPPDGARRREPLYRELVTVYFRESLRECGGLDLWKCAGTSSMERARIFWNRARLDGWRTFRNSQLTHADNGWQYHYPR